jgi:transposase, IS6 family
MTMRCERCAGDGFTKAGRDRFQRQLYRCRECRRRLTARTGSAFGGYRFPDEVIALAVRWYVRYRLSYADVAEWLAERGLTVDRSTVYRWVRRFLPLLREAARRYRWPVGGRWRVDETYCRLHGRWAYYYRAIDRDGQVVDVYLSERRNAAAAQAFFERAMDETGVTPERVVTDKAACYPPALRAVLPAAEHRTSKYLNNGVERDHGHLKQRLRPMRGFKRLASADLLTRGHALVQHLRKGFSALTARVPRPLRLATVWPQLARAI